MTQITAQLEADARKHMPEIKKIAHTFKEVQDKAGYITFPEAVTAMKKNGYVEMMPKAGRLKLTDKGAKFYKGMKKFGWA